MHDFATKALSLRGGRYLAKEWKPNSNLDLEPCNPGSTQETQRIAAPAVLRSPRATKDGGLTWDAAGPASDKPTLSALEKRARLHEDKRRRLERAPRAGAPPSKTS